ncbi:MAG: hypothetical protein WCN95_08160, partial [bacterium]
MHKRTPKIYEQGETVKQYVLAYYEGDRRIRMTFATMAEAEKAKREVEQRKTADVEKQTILSKKIGLQAEKLGPKDLLDAVKGLSILKRQTSLEIAATFYAKHHPAGKKRTVSECVNDFLLAKSEGGRRLATVKAYRDKLNLFTRNMNGKLINEITADVLEEWLRQRKVGTATRVPPRGLPTKRKFFRPNAS